MFPHDGLQYCTYRMVPAAPIMRGIIHRVLSSIESDVTNNRKYSMNIWCYVRFYIFMLGQPARRRNCSNIINYFCQLSPYLPNKCIANWSNELNPFVWLPFLIFIPHSNVEFLEWCLVHKDFLMVSIEVFLTVVSFLLGCFLMVGMVLNFSNNWE